MNLQNNQQTATNAYEMAGDNVLTQIMVNPDAWRIAYMKHKLRHTHFKTPRQQAVFYAIIELRKAGKDPDEVQILARSEKHGANLDYLADLANAHDAIIERNFEDSISVVYENGTACVMEKRLQKSLTDLPEKGFKAVKNELLSDLPQIGKAHVEKIVVMGEVMKGYREYLETTPPPTHFTGIDWFDNTVGGFTTDKEFTQLIWITAPYKGRKSTFMLNLALGVHASHYARGTHQHAPSTALLSREMPQYRINAQLHAMLSVNWLIANGHGKTNDNLGPLTNVSASRILKSRNLSRRWSGLRQKAHNYGLDTLGEVLKNTRVYDASPRGGSLSDFTNIEETILEDIELYGTQLVFIDYFQLLKSESSEQPDVTQLENGAHMLQRLVKQKGITIVILAQKNEESIKAGENGSKASAGIKGTGAAAATADHIFTTHYDGDESPDKLRVKLAFSREEQAGQSTVLDINASSGLITSVRWAEALGAPIPRGFEF